MCAPTSVCRDFAVVALRGREGPREGGGARAPRSGPPPALRRRYRAPWHHRPCGTGTGTHTFAQSQKGRAMHQTTTDKRGETTRTRESANGTNDKEWGHGSGETDRGVREGRAKRAEVQEGSGGGRQRDGERGGSSEKRRRGLARRRARLRMSRVLREPASSIVSPTPVKLPQRARGPQ